MVLLEKPQKNRSPGELKQRYHTGPRNIPLYWESAEGHGILRIPMFRYASMWDSWSVNIDTSLWNYDALAELALVFIQDIKLDFDALHQRLLELAQHRAQESISWLIHTSTMCISGSGILSAAGIPSVPGSSKSPGMFPMCPGSWWLMYLYSGWGHFMCSHSLRCTARFILWKSRQLSFGGTAQICWHSCLCGPSRHWAYWIKRSSICSTTATLFTTNISLELLIRHFSIYKAHLWEKCAHIWCDQVLEHIAVQLVWGFFKGFSANTRGSCSFSALGSKKVKWRDMLDSECREVTEMAEAEWQVCWWGCAVLLLIPWIGKYAFVHAGPISFPDGSGSQKGSLKDISILVLVAMSRVGRLTSPSKNSWSGHSYLRSCPREASRVLRWYSPPPPL